MSGWVARVGPGDEDLIVRQCEAEFRRKPAVGKCVVHHPRLRQTDAEQRRANAGGRPEGGIGLAQQEVAGLVEDFDVSGQKLNDVVGSDGQAVPVGGAAGEAERVHVHPDRERRDDPVLERVDAQPGGRAAGLDDRAAA
jgi:hypothetical protein